jgi:cytosine/adenosine deaminase-related metal-dependent hydrolase
MNRLSRAITYLAVACLVAACQPASQSTGTAIVNTTVIDAVNGIRTNHTVVYDGDEIIWVGPGGAPAEVAETIDGGGKYLVPGLWDFHVHLSYDERFTADMPALFLSWGVTSVRDTGGLMRKMVPIVERMRAPDAVAPRVWFAGPLLDGNLVVYDGESRPEIGVRNPTPEEARATVREITEQGVDFIKIYEMVSPAVFEAMVETARELGFPIGSHVPLSMLAGTAGPPVDSIEHLRNIELDCASNAAELHETRLEILKNADGLPGADLRSALHDLQRLPAIAAYDEARCDRVIDSLTSTIQVPTLRLAAMNLAPPSGKPDWNEALSRIRQDARQEWVASAAELAANPGDAFTEFGKWARFLTGRMHQRGVPIAAGTDTPILLAIPGYSLHAELEQLVASGLSPIEALRAATVRPAEFFGIENEIGTIDPVKRADLVLLDANTLFDITNTRRISGVISKGKLYDPAALATELRNRPE